jgi:choice-of-anchor A domain-containing protein
VIAFGSFSSTSGDVEQRLAVGGDFNVGSGWSVGYQINTDDGNVPYALLVAGNADFPSGAVYPDGSGSPHNVPAEGIFVGGSFTGPSYLSALVTSCSTPNCLASNFAAAQQCYSGYQQTLSQQGADNVNATIQWSGLYLTCFDVLATNYHMTLTAAQISEYTWVSTTNCNTNAKWVINVVGNDDVTFSGGSFPYAANQVVWNIQGRGRNINIQWTQVQGSILAPFNNINQPSGVVIGKVIANNINSLQINKVPCFTPANGNSNDDDSCGNGIVEAGEQCDGGSCCTSTCTYSSSSTVCRPAVSQCDVPEMCSGSSSSCGADVNYGFETSCGGLDFPLNGGDYSFTDYDVIVFGDFNGNTGDVERRLAVKNNFNVGNGYSVGYQIDSAETFSPFALVVGGDAHWGDGALYPNGQNTPYVAPEEYIFVGGAFTGASSLASLVTGSCGSSSPHCLDGYFNAAQSCYGGYQTALANNADNVAHVAQYSTLTVTCNSNTDVKYYISLTAAELNSVTSTTMNNCNHDAQWVVNVVGSDDVTFSGGSFFDGATQVVFNVQGSGRTINVGGYQMDGSLLAPYNTLSQSGGVIVGKVVVAEVTQMVQMNKYVCYNGHYQPPFIASDK